MGKFKTRTLIIASGIIWTAAAQHWLGGTGALVALFGHVAVYYLHSLEVRMNKLLSHHGLHVSDEEIDG